MRRLPHNPSPRRVRFDLPPDWVAVALGLIALGFLLTHIHPDYPVDGGNEQASSVSKDEAHHEHSTAISIDGAPCIGCRSFEEETTVPRHRVEPAATDLQAHAWSDRIDRTLRTPFSGLPATRAPPVG